MKHQIVVISDLHLNEGVQSPREDFYYDLEFSDFIDHWMDSKKRTHLIINGDFIEFLQITSLGPYKASRAEKKFGYGTAEQKSAWKMGKVLEGHKIFFRALHRFAKKGHKVFILKGNHDIELFWPKVQQAIYEGLDKIGRSRKIRENIKFLPWYYYEKGLVYIEHGNQYDEVNSFTNFLYPKLPGRSVLELPFGSFFLRYFFNKIEEDHPKVDEIKPTLAYLKWRASNPTWRNIPILLSYLPFLLRTWWKTKKRFSRHKIEKVRRKHKQALAKLDHFAAAIDRLRHPPIMTAKNFIWKTIKDHFSSTDYLYEAAKRIKEITGVKYVVFGHTHGPLQKDFYYNTGTWTHLPDIRRKADESRERKLTYLHIVGNKATLKEWAPLT